MQTVVDPPATSHESSEKREAWKEKEEEEEEEGSRESCVYGEEKLCEQCKKEKNFLGESLPKHLAQPLSTVCSPFFL